MPRLYLSLLAVAIVAGSTLAARQTYSNDIQHNFFPRGHYEDLYGRDVSDDLQAREFQRPILRAAKFDELSPRTWEELYNNREFVDFLEKRKVIRASSLSKLSSGSIKLSPRPSSGSSSGSSKPSGSTKLSSRPSSGSSSGSSKPSGSNTLRPSSDHSSKPNTPSPPPSLHKPLPPDPHLATQHTQEKPHVQEKPPAQEKSSKKSISKKLLTGLGVVGTLTGAAANAYSFPVSKAFYDSSKANVKNAGDSHKLTELEIQDQMAKASQRAQTGQVQVRRWLEDDKELFGRELDAEELFGREYEHLDERDIFDDFDEI